MSNSYWFYAKFGLTPDHCISVRSTTQDRSNDCRCAVSASDAYGTRTCFRRGQFGEMRNEPDGVTRSNLDGGNMIFGIIGEPPNLHARLRGSTERSREFVTDG